MGGGAVFNFLSICQTDAKASTSLSSALGQALGRDHLHSCKEEPWGLQEQDKYYLVLTILSLKKPETYYLKSPKS